MKDAVHAIQRSTTEWVDKDNERVPKEIFVLSRGQMVDGRREDSVGT